VVGVSSSQAIETAIEMGAIHEGVTYNDLGKVVPGADLIVLCTPIQRILELLTVLAPMLKPGALVTDVGSTKREITSHALHVLPKGVHFIGGHPMTGSEKSGITAADPFLFQNAMYILTPETDVPGEEILRLSGFAASLGARVIILDPALHDRIAATVSHLPQMLAVTLVNMVGQKASETEPYLQLAAGGFRDMTRIASSPYHMWDDICRTNRDAILNAIDEFMESLRDLKSRIGTSGLGGDFETANTVRASIPKDTKGFMHTLAEIMVVLEDRPGAIAGIAAVLASENINIKDIEIMKVREGEGGTLRLAFDTKQEAHQVIAILTQNGYTARLRN
jgi:prephenate dehydrogenase